MTLNANDVRNEYTASASQAVFNYTFKIYESTDLDVYVTPAGQACSSSDLTTAYTVSGVGNEAGGTITLTSAASSGDLVTIVSSIPTSRTTDYQNNGDFRPDTVNDDFDRAVSLVKQADERANRTLTFEDCQQGVTSLSLPTPDAGQYLRWKNDLSGVENAPVPSVTTTSETFGVNDYATLKAQTGQVNDQVIKVAYRSTEDDGGGGNFRWDDSDNSANVTADPGQGIYVPPNSDVTGAGGCWVRQYTGIIKAIWFTAGAVAPVDTQLQAALNQGDCDLENYTYDTQGAMTSAFNVYGNGAVINHTPTSDGVHILTLTGTKKECYGITAQNLNDQSSDFRSGDAFRVTGNNTVIHHCFVKSVFNVSRTEPSVGPSGVGAPLMMIFNGFNFDQCANSHGHDLDVEDGVYTAYRFNEAVDCFYYGIYAKNTYRAVMYAGDDVSNFSFFCKVYMAEFEAIQEIGYKAEVGCDTCKMNASSFKACCTLGAGTGGAEGRLGIIQGQDFTFDHNIVDCSTVNSALDSEGLIAAGGGSSTDVFGNGFKARHNTVINAKSTSGNTFPCFGINSVTDFEVDHNDINNTYQAISVSFGNDGSVSRNSAKNIDNHAIITARLVNCHIDNNIIFNAGNDGIRCDNAELGLSRNCSFNDNIVMEANRGIYLVRTKNCTTNSNTVMGSATRGIFANGNSHWTAQANGWDSTDISGSISSTVGNNTTLTPTLVDADVTVLSSTTATGEVSTDAPTGTLYWVVDQSSTPPSAAQIRVGQDSGGASADAFGNLSVTASGQRIINITGLVSATTYYLYLVQDDTFSNESNLISSASFTTS